MRLMQKWDEGIQTRFPTVLQLAHYGWFLCNMQYLHWSWCVRMSHLTFWQLGWLPCALCSAAARLTIVLQVFQNIWHIWQPQTGTPSSTPMEFTMLIGKRSFIFILCPSEYDQWRRKHAKDLSLIWALRSWESWHGAITLQRASPSDCLELLGDSHY